MSQNSLGNHFKCKLRPDKEFPVQLSPWLHLLWALSFSLVPWEALEVSKGTFSDTLIRLVGFLKNISIVVKKSTFFQGVSPWFLAKNDQILKS